MVLKERTEVVCSEESLFCGVLKMNLSDFPSNLFGFPSNLFGFHSHLFDFRSNSRHFQKNSVNRLHSPAE